MAHGADTGLKLMHGLLQAGNLSDYHLVYAAQADLLRRLDRPLDALVAYRRALELCQAAPDQRFLERRIAELKEVTSG